MFERIPSGIDGLDQLIEGGFVKGHQILLAGQSGTGKTIFGCQFLLEGARHGETSLYITIEESPESIVKNMQRFSWGEEFKEYVEDGTIEIERVVPSTVDGLIAFVLRKVEEANVKRLVIDSLTAAIMVMKDFLGSQNIIRPGMLKLVDALRKKGITSLLISEVPEDNPKKLGIYGFEVFLVDTAIKLYYINVAGVESFGLEVRKMRGTKLMKGIFQFVINDSGIHVKNEPMTVLLE